VSDDIAIQCIKPILHACEKNNEPYILEGFPKTRVQALWL